MKLTWLGHSCFKVDSKGYSIVIDPYADGYVEGLGPLRTEADRVLCTHEHGDHNARSVVTLREGGVSPFRITEIASFHDNVQGAKRGKNTIYLLEDGECRIAHLGDLGCGLTPEQKEKLSGLDALLVPVGGFFTIDAGQAKALAEELAPTVVVPMHYRGGKFGFEVLGTLEDFTRLCDDVVVYESNEIEIRKGLPRQTAVLTLNGN